VTQPAKKRTCARCGHHGYPAASFPERHLCWRCLTTALAAAGTCPGCGAAGRVLPGLRDGVPICRNCAGITRDFSCLRCGTETGMAPATRRSLRRLCDPCAVTWTAARLLHDGSGAIAAPLKPLAEALAAAPSPAAMLEWLDQPHIRDLLTCLAAGKLALTHEALDGWPRPRAVFYLRDLLVSCGVLPAVDKQLHEFQAWLDRRLENLAGHPHLRLLRQFGLWHQLSGMRSRAAAGPLRTTAAQYARSRFIQAQAFLTWTDALGVQPSALTQAHIDAYYASHASHQREGVRTFLVWAAGHGHIPGHLDIPRQQPYAGQVITQQRRLDLLRRFATDEAIPVRPRAAACLMLLYAQPLSSILRLAAADLSRDDWLFPGRHAGTPASPPPTVPWPPSSASTGCRCAPPGSQRCASSSCRFPLPSSPARSASTTPPPPASTSRQPHRGASTPAATASPDHTRCRALPAGQCPRQDSIPHRARQEQELRLGFGPARFFGALGLLEMVAVDRAVRVEADAAGSVDADPEQVVLAVLSQPEDDLDGHPLAVEAGHAFIEAIVEHGHPPVCLG
jgi:hypothetical protein